MATSTEREQTGWKGQAWEQDFSEHIFLYTSFNFLKNKTYFKIIVDLQKNCKDSREFLYTQLSLMVTSYITMVPLTKLRN